MDLWLDDPDPHIRELASVQLIDELFGPDLLDRLAKLNGCEEWLRKRRRELSPESPYF